MRKIMLIIERPDGTTYEQEVTVKDNETIEQALVRCERVLRSDYYICTYYVLD